MLTDTDEIDAQLVGEHRLIDDVADDLGLRKGSTVGVKRDVAERIEPELEIWLHDDEIRRDGWGDGRAARHDGEPPIATSCD
jgi:hypothetical protein